MKNAILLHGTNGSASDNWFPWLAKELKKRNWQVWVPDLPHAERPNIHRYMEFLAKNKNFYLDKDTVLVGHSSGAVAILGLLQHLPDETVVNTTILVGSFKNDLGWENLTELFEEPLDFAKIKKHAGHFVFIHADNDPYIPLAQARFLAKKVGGELIVKKGQGHFSLSSGPQHDKIPVVLEVLGLV